MDDVLLTQELLRDEGLRLFPYNDTEGKLTIGVGRNLTDVGISKAEAMSMLLADIRRTQAALDAQLPWWAHLDEVRQRVLVNMAFNMGIRKLLGFKNMLADNFVTVTPAFPPDVPDFLK